MRKLIVLASLLSLASVSCATKPAPENFTADLISVSPTESSPYWASMVKQYFREVINKRARYAIVAKDKPAPYTLNVRVFNQDRYFTGRVDKFRGVGMAVRIEATATLVEASSGKVVWQWEGWDSSKNEPKAVVGLAGKIARNLDEAGLLKPGGLAPDLAAR